MKLNLKNFKSYQCNSLKINHNFKVFYSSSNNNKKKMNYNNKIFQLIKKVKITINKVELKRIIIDLFQLEILIIIIDFN